MYICVDGEKSSELTRSVFCFIQTIEIANFKQVDQEQCNVHSVSVCIKVNVIGKVVFVLIVHIKQRDNIVSSSNSVRCLAVPDNWRTAEQSLTLSFCSISLIKNTLFGGFGMWRKDKFMFDINRSIVVNSNFTPRDEADKLRRFLYQRAIEAYQFHVNRYHTWMNYYSIFTGALFVGFCSLTTATTKIIEGSNSTLNHYCYIEHGKVLYTLDNNYTLLIIAICVLGIISSICWFMSLCGHEKWEHNWIKNIEYYEDGDENNDKNERIAESDKSYKSFILYKVIYENDFRAISTHIITKIFIISIILGWFVCFGNIIGGYCEGLFNKLLTDCIICSLLIILLFALLITSLVAIYIANKNPKHPKFLYSNIESKFLRSYKK